MWKPMPSKVVADLNVKIRVRPQKKELSKGDVEDG